MKMLIKARFSEFYVSYTVNMKYLTRILLMCLTVCSTMLIVRNNHCYIKQRCMLLYYVTQFIDSFTIIFMMNYGLFLYMEL